MTVLDALVIACVIAGIWLLIEVVVLAVRRHKGPVSGRWLGAASMIASAASFGAFSLYAKWHGYKTRIYRSQHPELFGPPRRPVPDEPPWPGVEGMNLTRMMLALVAICLLLLTLRRRSWGMALAALVIAVLFLHHVVIVI